MPGMAAPPRRACNASADRSGKRGPPWGGGSSGRGAWLLPGISWRSRNVSWSRCDSSSRSRAFSSSSACARAPISSTSCRFFSLQSPMQLLRKHALCACRQPTRQSVGSASHHASVNLCTLFVPWFADYTLQWAIQKGPFTAPKVRERSKSKVQCGTYRSQSIQVITRMKGCWPCNCCTGADPGETVLALPLPWVFNGVQNWLWQSPSGLHLACIWLRSLRLSLGTAGTPCWVSWAYMPAHITPVCHTTWWHRKEKTSPLVPLDFKSMHALSERSNLLLITMT